MRDSKAIEAIKQSEEEHSLSILVQRWLSRTPGLETHDFDFWGKYKRSVEKMLIEQEQAAHVIMFNQFYNMCILSNYLKYILLIILKFFLEIIPIADAKY